MGRATEPAGEGRHPVLSRHPFLALYVASLLFAVMGLAVKLATGGAAPAAGPAWQWFAARPLPPLEVVFYRSLLPLALLAPLVAGELRRRWPVVRRLGGLLVLRGVTGGLAMAFYFVAIQDLGLSTAVVLNYTSPLWATIFSAWFLGEPVPRRVAWAFPVAFAGVVLMVQPEAALPGEGSSLASYGLGLASGVLAGAAYVAVRRLSAEVSPALVVFTFSAVTCLGVLPWVGTGYVAPDGNGWALLAVIGLAASAAQLLMTFGYRLNSASRASTLTLATVAFSTLAAVALLGERPTPGEWAGLALTAGGVALATSGRAERLRTEPPP